VLVLFDGIVKEVTHVHFFNKKLIIASLLISLTTHAGEVTEVIGQSDILAWTSASDTDPRALEALPGGLLAYFEDDSGAGVAQDSVILVDPAQVGNNRFTVLVDEDTLEDLSPSKVYGAHVSDMVRDATGNLYLMVTGIWNGKSRYDNFVVRVPYSGGSYGTPTRVVDVPDDGYQRDNRTYHRLAVLGDDLWILYDNLTGADDDTVNGVYHFDLTGTLPGSTSDLSLITTLHDVGQVLDNPPTANDDFGLWQIRVDSNGDLFGFVYENGSGSTGDLLVIDGATGATAVAMSQQQAERETGIDKVFQDETNLSIASGTDHFFIMETGTGTEEREIVFEFDETLSFVAQHAHHFQIEDAAPDINDSLSTVASNAITVGPGGDIYVFFTLDDDVSLVEIDPDVTCNHNLTYAWPTSDGSMPTVDLASGYGPRQLASGGYRYDFHRGIDIDMPIGTTIYAVADGVVEKAGSHGSFSEPVVAIRHGDCAPYVYSYYLHLTSASVSVGDSVSQGDPIALSGESSSGYDHLHFEMRVGGTWQAHCENPLGYLPYTDTTPIAPSLEGANDSGDGVVLYFEGTTPDEEFDPNGFGFHWGGDSGVWDWQAANKANGPDFPARMDRPIVEINGSVFGVAFAEFTNSESDEAVRSFAVAELDAGASSGTVGFFDIAGTIAWTNVDLTGLPELSLTPSVLATASPGDVVDLDFTLTNPGLSTVNVTLTARSSAANTIDLSQNAVMLAPNASTTVTVTVTLNANHPVGVGDGILLIADAGTTLPMVAVGDILTE